MLFAIFPENSFFLLEIGKFLVIPALLGAWQAVQWLIGYSTNRKEKAAEQLERLFVLLTEDVGRKNARVKQLETDYESLGDDHDRLKTKVRKSRGELLETKPILARALRVALEDENQRELKNQLEEIEELILSAIERLNLNPHNSE